MKMGVKLKDIGLISVIIIVSLFSSGYRKTDAGGVKIRPTQDITLQRTAAAADYCQRSKKWAADKIGRSKTDMYHSGCMICCIAASIYLQGGDGYTPASLNGFLGENNVYTDGGAIQWDIMEKCMKGVYVDLSDKTSDPSVEKELNDGYAPIVKVKRPSGAYHWILITGASGGSYDCMDPIDGDVTLDAYDDTIYSIRVIKVGKK